LIKSLIQLAARTSVQPQWDGRFRRRDEPSRARIQTGASGETWWTDGADGRLSLRAVYVIVIGLVAASTVVSIFSTARDISWRLGSPQNLWEPVLWNVTSAIVGVAVLPLVRRGALLFRDRPVRPLTAAAAFVALALAYSALHIAGMGVLRELAYALGGWSYTFPWSRQIPYELRKDLFVYLVIAIIFWFAERPAGAAPVQTEQVAPKVADNAPARPEFWLRDGRTSVLIDAGEIVSVTSAGNYVEYELTDRRKHLIRATLQAEEARLAPFGIARVHRSRLINLKRIVALHWRPSGDFELRLDSGEVVVGSRRYKTAMAGLAD
jgi:DNA-binding LytR/AlgR family response regulator